MLNPTVIPKDENNPDMDLYLPYIPHARMDRVKSSNEFFTLKHFADVINSLNFTEVRIFDPHSNVCTALINNIKVEHPQEMINKTISAIPNKNGLVAFYPDEGAMKRGTDYIKGAYAFGIKKRDWETGKILGLELMNKDVVKDRDVLIIDDIQFLGGATQTQEEFFHTFNNLYNDKFNLLILHVRPFSDSIYPSKIFPTSFSKISCNRILAASGIMDSFAFNPSFIKSSTSKSISSKEIPPEVTCDSLKGYNPSKVYSRLVNNSYTDLLILER